MASRWVVQISHLQRFFFSKHVKKKMPLWSWVRLYLATSILNVALGPFCLSKDFWKDILKRKYFLHSCVFQIPSALALDLQSILGCVVLLLRTWLSLMQQKLNKIRCMYNINSNIVLAIIIHLYLIWMATIKTSNAYRILTEKESQTKKVLIFELMLLLFLCFKLKFDMLWPQCPKKKIQEERKGRYCLQKMFTADNVLLFSTTHM